MKNAPSSLDALLDNCGVLPVPAPIEPLAFLDDTLAPRGLARVEPAAYVLTCVRSLWGAHGPRN